MPRPTHVNQTTAALLTGYNQSQISRLAADGTFGNRERGRTGKMVELAAVERFVGRQFTDAELARATNRVSDSDIEKWRLLFDPGWVATIVSERDSDWIIELTKRGMSVPTPPLPTQAQLTPALQELYTRDHVATLIANAIRLNNAQWRQWAVDAVSRASFPHGPPDININLKDLKE